MDEYIEKHLYDVLLSIEETESTLRAGQKSTKISRKISSAKELAAEEDKGKLGKQNKAVAKITRKACF